LLLALFLTACGQGVNAEAWGNIGVVAFPNELPDYDPSIMGLNEPAVLLNVYETLTFWTPDGLQPRLATEWKSNEAGDVWTFKLRQGVTFHDGVEFTAAAVISSFQRTIDKGVLSYVFLPVAEMTIIDDYTVQFVLEYPAPLDYIFSNLYGVMIMSPAALAQDSDWFRENEAGTVLTRSAATTKTSAWCWRATMITGAVGRMISTPLSSMSSSRMAPPGNR